MTKIRL